MSQIDGEGEDGRLNAADVTCNTDCIAGDPTSCAFEMEMHLLKQKHAAEALAKAVEQINSMGGRALIE